MFTPPGLTPGGVLLPPGTLGGSKKHKILASVLANHQERNLMKKLSPSLFYFFFAVFLLSVLDLTWARAPETAKIVFSSDREGDLDLYLMNPDGSEDCETN